MKRFVAVFLVIALTFTTLPMGGCNEQVVFSVIAVRDMSAVYYESGDRFLWGDGKPYGGENVLSPQPFALDIGILEAAGYNFALWTSNGTLYATGVEDGLPLGVLSGKQLEKPIRIVPKDWEPAEPITNDEYNLVYIDEDLTTTKQIAAGDEHTLLLKSDGTVWAWGMNALGQLGQGTAGIAIRTPVRVGNLEAIMKIATGRLGCSAALDMNGKVWCWGGSEELAAPVVIEGFTEKIEQIAAGNDFWVAVDDGRRVWTWNLGDMTPRIVEGVSAFNMAAGDDFVVALNGDGTVWTWGANAYGQLGRDTGGMPDEVPKQVEGLKNVSRIAAGSGHVLVMKKDETIWSWGRNNHGQLGDGTTNDSIVPLKLKLR